MLDDIAYSILGARRISKGYRPALRYVLGNQAYADRRGLLLEINTDTEVGSPRTMRTINDQLLQARITFKRWRPTTGGFSESVNCYSPPGLLWANEYEALVRAQEDDDDARMAAAGGTFRPPEMPSSITASDIPY